MTHLNEKNWNGLRMRKHFASNVWITEDGEHLEVFYIDKKTNLEKSFNLSVFKGTNGRRFIKDRNGSVHHCDEMVATCFLPPGNGLVLSHKDSNIENDHYKNLEWIVPYGKNQVSGRVLQSQIPSNKPSNINFNNSNTISLPNSLVVTPKGDIFQNGQQLVVRKYKFDPYEGTKYQQPPYVVYEDSLNGKRRALSIDTLMSQAGLISGNKSCFKNPVILHKDNNPLNFDSSNLEWVDASDPRYQIYKTFKAKP